MNTLQAKMHYVFDRYFLQQMHESNVDEVTWHCYVFYQYVHLLRIKPMISSSLYPVQGRSKMVLITTLLIKNISIFQVKSMCYLQFVIIYEM